MAISVVRVSFTALTDHTTVRTQTVELREYLVTNPTGWANITLDIHRTSDPGNPAAIESMTAWWRPVMYLDASGEYEVGRWLPVNFDIASVTAKEYPDGALPEFRSAGESFGQFSTPKVFFG